MYFIHICVLQSQVYNSENLPTFFCYDIKGPDLLDQVGGLHNFMNWKRAILTVDYSLISLFTGRVSLYNKILLLSP